MTCILIMPCRLSDRQLRTVSDSIQKQPEYGCLFPANFQVGKCRETLWKSWESADRQQSFSVHKWLHVQSLRQPSASYAFTKSQPKYRYRRPAVRNAGHPLCIRSNHPLIPLKYETSNQTLIICAYADYQLDCPDNCLFPSTQQDTCNKWIVIQKN